MVLRYTDIIEETSLWELFRNVLLNPWATFYFLECIEFNAEKKNF
jgi:hypothetical protein